MPDSPNTSGNSDLAAKIGKITAVVLALAALVTAIIKFRDSIPWLTPVNSIELAPNPVNLAIGDKSQIVATVRDSNKNPLGKKVSWSCANPALVQIDAEGIVTGIAAGQTTITASIGFVKALTQITVRRVNVATVEVFPPSTTLLVDDHLKFDATPYDSEGNSLLGRPIRWASENNSVAAVDLDSGDTTGRSAGSVRITAESETKLSTAQVTVNPKPASPTVAPPPSAPAPSTATASGASSGGEASRPIDKKSAVDARMAHEAARPPSVGAAHLPALATSARALTLALADKITFVGGLKFADCPANIRILIGESLIDLKSDPQEADRIPLGDQPYRLHGIVSCPGQTPAVVNGRGSIPVSNGKSYRCAWLRKGPKDFEITLQSQ